MAHTRKRYLEQLIRRGLSFKGIVGIFGHRQVGKTTLLELISHRYSTLDKASELLRVTGNPEYFLEEMARNRSEWPVAIDECQLAPTLFPALKEYVRVHKMPGIFLLSGSVRFTSRKAIRESLTGRILGYELLPFSIGELEQRPMNCLALNLFGKNLLSLELDTSSFKGLEKQQNARRYLQVGGLPGICFVRSERDRFELLESQLTLMLDRDLRLVLETTLSQSRLRTLLQILAQTQNQPINYTDLSRRARISVPTLKKVLNALESIFLIRMIPCEGDEVAPVCFLEDQGEAQFLAERPIDLIRDMERLAFSHLRVPFNYTHGVRAEVFQYRRHGGAYVPLVYRVGQNSVGFICTSEETPSLSARRSSLSFLESYPGSKIIFLHPGRKLSAISSDELALPLEAVF